MEAPLRFLHAEVVRLLGQQHDVRAEPIDDRCRITPDAFDPGPADTGELGLVGRGVVAAGGPLAIAGPHRRSSLLHQFHAKVLVLPCLVLVEAEIEKRLVGQSDVAVENHVGVSFGDKKNASRALHVSAQHSYKRVNIQLSEFSVR